MKGAKGKHSGFGQI